MTALSPFRQLARAYSNELVSREDYVKIRARLLKKLRNTGHVSESDLPDFSKMNQYADAPGTRRSYSMSDWIIIALGLAAALVLGMLLYG